MVDMMVSAWDDPWWAEFERQSLKVPIWTDEDLEEPTMKLTYTSPNGRIRFEVEVTTGKAAFEVMGAIQELFEEPDCGCCQSKTIRCDVRHIEGNSYFKMLCLACGATLDFGQHKDGKGLFVKRRDENKQPLPNRGWYIYQAR